VNTGSSRVTGRQSLAFMLTLVVAHGHRPARRSTVRPGAAIDTEESMSTAGDNDASGDIRQVPSFIGDLHGVLMERIPALVHLSADEREQRGLDGLAELRQHDLLTDEEVD
jgi:hypothetical protein